MMKPLTSVRVRVDGVDFSVSHSASVCPVTDAGRVIHKAARKQVTILQTAKALSRRDTMRRVNCVTVQGFSGV